MVDSEQTSRGLSRRDMIKGAAAAGAAAWTAPVIIDSLTSPAGAFTPPPCPDVPGNYYAVVWSPSTTALEDRDPNGDGFAQVAYGGCTNLAIPTSGGVGSGAACHAPAGYGRTYAGSIKLKVQGVNISHNINTQINGPQQAVTIKLDSQSCCKITGVRAFVHKFQSASTGTDCPTEYCQPAIEALGVLDNNSTDMLRYNKISDKEWSVWPNSNPSLCSGGANGSGVGIHWGSPNQSAACTGYAAGAKAIGQSHGFMLITLNCAPGFVGQT